MALPSMVKDRRLPQDRSKDRSPSVRGFDFEAISISIASPEEIFSWSYGEILKPETINYRTQKPERDGLFDEKIFGPVKDFECYCGKYRKIRYEGVICDKCGVEVTKSIVRRERMGHIDLAACVTHIWYVRGVPSIIGLLLDLSVSDLEKVVYFAAYLVLEVNEDIRKAALTNLELEYKQIRKEEEERKGSDVEKRLATLDLAFREERTEVTNVSRLQIMTEAHYQSLSLKYGSLVRVGIGAEAILEMLELINVEEGIKAVEAQVAKDTSPNRRKLLRRLALLTGFHKSHIIPSILIMRRLPVIPPDLRPMVQLDGGRFAASDLNDLYRRVINRNNRLKRLLSTGAPEVITRNEKRMLQEAVDALIDNSANRGKAVTAVGNRRKLRSLSDMLRGKQGRFRQNLLGKRVDYSGRSVIVIGPDLHLHQCGLPKVMAMELFKPFVIGRLIRDGFVHNVKNATRLIEQGEPFVWDILEDITRNHYVLLNRAPTLHRLSIQAFQPVLIEGKAIQIHPLVCHAFNADFDGDQMAVHVPLSSQAQWEASELMRSSYNFLKPASGEPIVSPRLDMVWGLYYLTTPQKGTPGEGKQFASEEEAIAAFEFGALHLRAPITCLVSKIVDGVPVGKPVQTTLGLVLLNRALPEDFPFQLQPIDQRSVRRLISEILERYGKQVTAEVLDRVKKLGFSTSEGSGMTFSVDDLVIPKEKPALMKQAEGELEQIERQFARGLINQLERSEKTIGLWKRVDTDLKKLMLEEYAEHNSIMTMVKSGARGSVSQLSQLSCMKGLMVNPVGEIIEIPIKSSQKEGLTEYEYFISTHGSRKGRVDTALRTSVAGYLTRRLIDVAQDIFVAITDCGTEDGIEVPMSGEKEQVHQRIYGRVLAKKAGKFTAGTLITKEKAVELEESKLPSVTIRTLLTCQAERGICQHCYGIDLATGELAELGSVVGVVAAQAIGEPGTQLTMKTFHTGGVAGEDITTGLPRVEELFEVRLPKSPAIMAEMDGRVSVVETQEERSINLTGKEKQVETIVIPEGYKVLVKDDETIKAKQPIGLSNDQKVIRAPIGGTAQVSGRTVQITGRNNAIAAYPVPSHLSIRVSDGDEVTSGQLLTDGHMDLQQAMTTISEYQVARYIIEEVQAVYAAQGQAIADKHIECIIKQMFSKVRITSPGESELLNGEVVERRRIKQINQALTEKKKPLAQFETVLLGITKIALRAESFLAAASFQETTQVLIGAAVRGAVDQLKGLKENVIIGKLIPAGTGFINPEATPPKE